MATKPRIYKTIVSNYQRARIAQPTFVRGEQFVQSVNLNGVLDDGEIITQATWYSWVNNSIILGQAQTENREASIQVEIGWGPGSALKCDLTTSTGRVITQLWRYIILGAPFFQDESNPPVGPASVTAYNIPQPPIDIEIEPGAMTADGMTYTSAACSVFEAIDPGVCGSQNPDSISLSTAILTVYAAISVDPDNCTDLVTGTTPGASSDVLSDLSAEIVGTEIVWTLTNYAGSVPFIIEITGSISTTGGTDDSLVCQCYGEEAPP